MPVGCSNKNTDNSHRMSEFLSIVAIIGDCVSWIISKSIDGFCLTLLASSAIFPWRLWELSQSFEFDSKWRKRAFQNFFLTLLDCLCFPCLLLLLPFVERWKACRDVFEERFGQQYRDPYKMSNMVDFRVKIVLLFLTSVMDLMTTPFLVLTFGSPLRLHYFVVHFSRIFSFRPNEIEPNVILVKLGVGAILDVLVIPLGIVSALSPLRSRQFLTSAQAAVADTYFTTAEGIPGQNQPPFIDSFMEKHVYKMNYLALIHGMASMVDVACVPLCILTLISPIRFVTMVSRIRTTLALPFTSRWAFDANSVMLKMFVAGLIDWLSVPFILVAVGTLTRAFPFVTEIYHALCRPSTPEPPNMTPNATPYVPDFNLAHDIEINLLGVITAVAGYVDLLCIIPGAVMGLMSPTCWNLLIWGTLDLIRTEKPTQEQLSACGRVFDRFWRWDQFYGLVRNHFLSMIPAALLDVLAALGALLALLSPLRHTAFRAALAAEIARGRMAPSEAEAEAEAEAANHITRPLFKEADGRSTEVGYQVVSVDEETGREVVDESKRNMRLGDGIAHNPAPSAAPLESLEEGFGKIPAIVDGFKKAVVSDGTDLALKNERADDTLSDGMKKGDNERTMIDAKSDTDVNVHVTGQVAMSQIDTSNTNIPAEPNYEVDNSFVGAKIEFQLLATDSGGDDEADKFCKGAIIDAHHDGTFSVAGEDGVKEMFIDRSRIRLLLPREEGVPDSTTLELVPLGESLTKGDRLSFDSHNIDFTAIYDANRDSDSDLVGAFPSDIDHQAVPGPTSQSNVSVLGPTSQSNVSTMQVLRSVPVELEIEFGFFSYKRKYYNAAIRKLCFYFGVMAVLDLMMMPFLLPLLVTWYRFKPVKDELMTTAQWGMREFVVVLRQFGLLVIDIILLPAIALLFATRIRWKPVEKVMAVDDWCSIKSLATHSVVVFKFSQLVLDAALSPFIFLLFVLQYRKQALVQIWEIDDLWHDTFFHEAVLLNACIVLHDVLLLGPCVLLTLLLAAYRAQEIFNIVKVNWLQFRAQEMGVNKFQVILQASRVQNNMDDTIWRAEIRRAMDPKWTWRGDLWYHFGGLCLDLPCAPFGLVVVVTIWRASTLMNAVRKTLATHRSSHTWKREMAARLQVLSEFVLLVRDALFLGPFAILIATVVRFPGVYASIKSRFSAAPLTEGPTYTVTGGRMSFPERGGPTLELDLVPSEESSSSAGDSISAMKAGVGPDQAFIPSSTHPTQDAAPLTGASGGGLSPKATSNGDEGDEKVDDMGVVHERGHQSSQLELTVVPESTNAKRIAAPTHLTTRPTIVIDTSSPALVHLLGKTFWQRVASQFGDGVTAIARSMLPLPMREGNEITLSVLNSGDNVGAKTIRMQFDFGTTKRTTLIKKLSKLSGTDVMVIQVEVMATSSQDDAISRRIVLLRLCPTVEEVIECVTAKSCPLPTTLLTGSQVRYVNNVQLATESDDGGIVAAFHIIVGLAFLQLVLDVVHTLMVFFVLCLPWRGIPLLIALFENSAKMPWRVGGKCLRMLRHAEVALLDYKADVGPILNQLTKEALSKDTIENFQYSAVYLNSHTEEALKSAERRHLSTYQAVSKRIINTLESFEGCEALAELMSRRLAIHHTLVHFWFLRSAIPWALECGANLDGSIYGAIFGMLLARHKKAVQDLILNTTNIDQELKRLEDLGLGVNTAPVAAHDVLSSTGEQGREDKMTVAAPPKKSLLKRLKKVGLIDRPLELSRQLIRMMTLQALADLGFIVLFLVLVGTLVRALPLFKDLWNHNSFSPTRFTTRTILVRHVRGLMFDLRDMLILLGYVVLIAASGVCVPAFLVDIPYHCTSFKAAIKCAEKHLEDACTYLGEILSLVIAFHTYKVLVRAIMYGILVPAACLAESFPLRSLDKVFRFIIGLIVWIGLLAGGISTSWHGVELGAHESLWTETANVPDANLSLIGFCTALCGVLVLGALSVSNREEYLKPHEAATSGSTLTWSHVLALLTGPFEAIQLAGVVLFFFWQPSLLSPPLDPRSSFEDNVYASAMYAWGSESDDKLRGYKPSLVIAAVAILSWAVLVALPLATHARDESRRFAKMSAIKSSPLYDFVSVLISRLFAVWIMVTLLRSTSCGSMEFIAPLPSNSSQTTVSTFNYTAFNYTAFNYTAINYTAINYTAFNYTAINYTAFNYTVFNNTALNNTAFNLTSPIVSATATVWRPEVDVVNSQQNYTRMVSFFTSTDTSMRCGGGTGDNRNWFSTVSLCLLAYFLVTASVLHADDAQLLAAADSTEVQGHTAGVRFAPLYATAMRLIQFYVCVMCTGFFPALNTNPNVALGIICVLCAMMTALPLLFKDRNVCSFYPIAVLRSGGALAVLWTAIVCFFRQNAVEINGVVSNAIWAGADALYIGWGVITGATLLLTCYVHVRAAEAWQQRLLNSGLENAVDSVIEAMDNMAMDEGLATKFKTKDVGRLKSKAKAANSYVELARVVAWMEEQIPPDRLTPVFVKGRDDWKKTLLLTSAVAEEAVDLDAAMYDAQSAAGRRVDPDAAFLRVSGAIQSLTSALRPQHTATEFSRILLSLLLSRKVPMEISWEILSYCLDVSPLKVILHRTLEVDPHPVDRQSVLAFDGRMPEYSHPFATRKLVELIHQLFRLRSRLAFPRQEIIRIRFKQPPSVVRVPIFLAPANTSEYLAWNEEVEAFAEVRDNAYYLVRGGAVHKDDSLFDIIRDW